MDGGSQIVRLPVCHIGSGAAGHHLVSPNIVRSEEMWVVVQPHFLRWEEGGPTHTGSSTNNDDSDINST